MTSNKLAQKEKETWIAKVNIDTLIANTGGAVSEFDLDRVRLSGGGWQAPTLEGSLANAPTLTGVIVHWRDCRAYWSSDMSSGTSAPDCFSRDSKVGVGTPGGDCTMCQYSQFGSDGGRGQACKLMRQLLLLQEGELIPKIVILPPTSVGPCRKYFLRLASAGKPIWSVITELGIAQARNAQGITYPVATFKLVGEVPQDITDELRNYGNVVGALISGREITAEDYIG